MATILVVDDEPLIINATCRIIECMGHDTKTASNGKQALAAYTEGGIDLVVSDFRMPGMNGLELLERLKELDPRVKMIVASGNFKKEEKAALLEAGAIKVFDKPYSTSALIEAINSNLLIKKTLEASGIKGKKPSSEGPMQARKTLKILLVDDYKNSLRVMEAIVKGLGHDTKTARSGEEALEIYREGGADLVITDYKMPGMNGVELLKELKELNPDVKVILVTAFGNALDKEAIVKAGAIAVLDKPMERDDIKNAIDAVSQNQ